MNIKKFKKYILFLIIILVIFSGCYIYFINNTEYKPPYCYSGSTVDYFNNEHNGHKFGKSDWDIQYIVEPLDQSDFSSPRLFNNNDKLNVLDSYKMNITGIPSNDTPYQGKVYLHYNGDNSNLIEQTSKTQIAINWGLAGDPFITSGFYDVETSGLLDSSKQTIYDYLPNDNFTPHKIATMYFELRLTLLDDTKVRYFGYISAGPKSIFNFEYLMKRHF